MLGLAAEASWVRGLALFAEFYRGDVCEARSTMIAAHGGVWWRPTDSLQMDATVGTTLPSVSASNERPTQWFTTGLTLQIEPL